MNRAGLVDKIADMIASASRHGSVAALMAAQERDDGNTVVPVGAYQPFRFPAEDWIENGVVSVTPAGEVRLVAILARKPGTGALRQLVGNIQRAGLGPVVIEPVGEVMPAIMKHWRWKRTVRGKGWERFEEWRPPVQLGVKPEGRNTGTNQNEGPKS